MLTAHELTLVLDAGPKVMHATLQNFTIHAQQYPNILGLDVTVCATLQVQAHHSLQHNL